MNYLALMITLLTYSLIVTRGVTKIPPWASMFLGGVLMVTLGVLSPQQALQSINMDVILFLVTLFIFASALEVSGFLKFLAAYIVEKLREPKRVLLGVLVLSGILSNLVTNDGISASWTPVILESSRRLGTEEKPFLYALAFGVTIGSVMLPTGNPQNLLIALNGGIRDPFLTFMMYLAIPTLINLLLSYPILLMMFRNKLSSYSARDKEVIRLDDPKLAYLSIILLTITVGGFFLLSILGVDILIASLTTSSLLLLLTHKRREIVRRMDWSTIIFFMGLFMFTQGMIQGGVLETLFKYLPQPSSVLAIMVVSVALSQVISNVPLVAIYIPFMLAHGDVSVSDMLSLAAGSTIAGNLTLIGAASNVIISEASESRGGKGFGFFEFIKYSLPILAVNFIVLYLFLGL
ncbi:Na+/H+ antiporter NhaD-like permease [Metallosphaera yellowstonensis MK1]|jgi:Na+/H+ antiporter NhaD/arsenite permease-like protein|uniref:Na+/H+ antiporter NhaD-like permease n=1 Tax=Metallosphaera yellowstonensis MK1 TaxID=671065 RepID=H2C8X7_9CREN|nr:SLC13 family permease [Metallosphaera yellowstonensis]EHP68603.1 Na+/H+ antiporter NhaD-like permease [Metallosphaera yellowstonensis MK1]